MKRTRIIAASLAMAASIGIATPTFGVTRDPCAVLQKQLDTLELRLARQGIESRRGSRTYAKILELQQTAKALKCKVKIGK